MIFKHDVVIAEVGEERTSARGNYYVPAKLEVPTDGKWPESYSVAAMGSTADDLRRFNIGDTVTATFEVRQWKQEVKLQLKAIEESVPFGE